MSHLAGALRRMSTTDSKHVVRCAQCGNDTVVSVRNAGEPIGMGDIPRLFEPFYRASQPEASAPGWGLGLAFVKRIAEKHGGSVQARNHESGTTFELHLPAVAAAATVGGPT